ncbi:MAG: hypothetical protein A2504_01660 [Bdellovibrionales bacterium RIFOXYD12_FULL_39_22]|nr:MAG: hypothetical protein A2385_04185 [Bdellovibrionales bacterium RIFOXYB1_FULL_39_21]OFZ42388.1 MAG: hypothetical protein A2485_15310 [Bdellovibrionales bacterium RIFOXYC12_FULL_39_17]OFZ46311.1 MAG: hypothetical protein A2404_13705 [Bdellovibrionales bacterium RIFOXYC1_FULL_39_130]OFZ75204.1 MAG: hypothetical protein A2560_15760 [Bdellovibrionales bacterium RIFOXYD1_FULL_39_84]OFZ93198.1 MAG: hypothetical protein A2504_01660 [Bdellovibrionales bacterium RIFOXYD12_FULL_39_22]
MENKKVSDELITILQSYPDPKWEYKTEDYANFPMNQHYANELLTFIDVEYIASEKYFASNKRRSYDRH